ncbi:metal-dependent hydrolase [Methanobacterium alcaliphilum]|uniref:metal-dependent hydrolase n=1 Tax=Methanobacterium alcaliphilum TaxID=392018 RepID=UPI00200B1F1B|nr:metal-dependent hydrolase [Methanobacterium alcaliphilum]MCK9150517.1 metal-dependent hydrolase [Methanobacterium alcaliphilum]
MKFYTHIAGGIFFFLLLSFPLNITSPMPGILFAAWSSIFPNSLDKITGTRRNWGHSLIWIIPIGVVTIYSSEIALSLIIGFLSHIILDCFTVYGSPVFYPFKKSGFVCLNKKMRFKTGAKPDKTVFLFLTLMICSVVFLSSGIYELFPNNSLQAASAAEEGNSSGMEKNNIYLNLKLDENCNKNITLEKVNENKTQIIIQDIESHV